MTEEKFDKVLFERASNMLRVQGIITIVFGALGVLFGSLMMIAFGLSALYDHTFNGPAQLFFMAIVTFVLFILPHIYLIISGITLSRQPQPNVARILTIINLAIGVFWNLIILIFAIISLTQSSDYERHFPISKK